MVIGIFIAIQLNNLNEKRKLNNREDAYYCKILEDVNQDATQLDRLLQQTVERIKHGNQMLGLLQQDELDSKAISTEMLGAISLVTYTFKPSLSAFEDIKSSGNLGILDESIKKDLIEYYTTIEGIVDVVDINADQSVRVYSNKENYSKIGWQLIPVVDEAIDGDVVDKERLKSLVIVEDNYREKLTSDVIYIIGAGARVKMLYEGMKKDIEEMNKILQVKCNQSN